MNSRVFCQIPLVALLSGCVTVFDRYTEPVTEPTAKVRFVAASDLGGSVHVFRILGDAPCGTYSSVTQTNMRFISVLHGITVERKAIGLPLAENLTEKNFTEILVPPGSPFIFDMMNFTSGFGGINSTAGTFSISASRCNLTSQFIPEAGHIYEAVLSRQHNGCSVSLVEIAKSSDGAYFKRPESTWKKSSTQCKWN